MSARKNSNSPTFAVHQAPRVSGHGGITPTRDGWGCIPRARHHVASLHNRRTVCLCRVLPLARRTICTLVGRLHRFVAPVSAIVRWTAIPIPIAPGAVAPVAVSISFVGIVPSRGLARSNIARGRFARASWRFQRAIRAPFVLSLISIVPRGVVLRGASPCAVSRLSCITSAIVARKACVRGIGTGGVIRAAPLAGMRRNPTTVCAKL